LLYVISYFLGGMFLTNGIPHFISGVMGRPFQSPFAKPPGQGLSSSRVNVVWGYSKIVMFYILVLRVGVFDLRNTTDVIALGAGILTIALPLARQFGKYNGGNLPGHN
jgi:hypothetical protein